MAHCRQRVIAYSVRGQRSVLEDVTRTPKTSYTPVWSNGSCFFCKSHTHTHTWANPETKMYAVVKDRAIIAQKKERRHRDMVVVVQFSNSLKWTHAWLMPMFAVWARTVESLTNKHFPQCVGWKSENVPKSLMGRYISGPIRQSKWHHVWKERERYSHSNE